MKHNLDKIQKRLDVFGEEVDKNPRYIDEDNPWNHWGSMPAYDPYGKECFAEFEIEFEDDAARQKFAMLAEQTITESTKYIWYPKIEKNNLSRLRYVSDGAPEHQPKYPIYIVSKGRWERRPTSDALCKMQVPHYIVVEQSQYSEYASRVDANFVTVLVLDQRYLDEYDTFDNLGSTKSKGPGAARNFAWEHSIASGHARHWVMDDNIEGFCRLEDQHRIRVADGAIFRAMEDHTDRYKNVAMSGPHYRFFVMPDKRRAPFTLNTRVYSCNLILNSAPFRWRGRYNEDTDLSLQMLKAGWCTFQYSAFLQDKMVTQSMKGGNTDEFYNKEGTLPKSKMLEEMHPDVARVVWMNNRWHHYVDYRIFCKTRLQLKRAIPDGVYNYGMELRSI